MELPRFDATVDDASLAAALDQAGCCVIEAAETEATMDAIASELAPFASAASMGASAFEGHDTRRTGSPLPRSATFRSIALPPAVVAAGDHVLGHATSWRYSAAEYIEIGPGETPQRLHRDAWKYDRVDFGFEVELNGIGRSPTSPKQTGRPGSSLAAIAGSIGPNPIPPTRFLPRWRRDRSCFRPASSSTAVVRTPPASGEGAFRFSTPSAG